MTIDVGTVVVGGLIQTGIGLGFWFAVQRTVQKLDELQKQLAELKDKQVAALAGDIKAEGEKRRQIYQRIGDIERTMVSKSECHEQHKELADGQQEFRSAVVDLGRVQEKLTNTANFVDEVNQRVIGLKEDVARMEGRDEARR